MTKRLYRDYIKRFLDIVLSAGAIIVLSPVCLLYTSRCVYETAFYLDGKAADMAVGSGSEAGHGTLSLAAPENECEDHFTYDPENPSTHIIDMSENELEVPENYTDEEKRIDMLSYSTGVLEKEFTITGDAQAVIYLSSDCEDTDLMVRITDVDENGRSMKLADGVMSCLLYTSRCV